MIQKKFLEALYKATNEEIDMYKETFERIVQQHRDTFRRENFDNLTWFVDEVHSTHYNLQRAEHRMTLLNDLHCAICYCLEAAKEGDTRSKEFRQMITDINTIVKELTVKELTEEEEAE